MTAAAAAELCRAAVEVYIHVSHELEKKINYSVIVQNLKGIWKYLNY